MQKMKFNTKYVIKGHNGAGKTTVTFMLCGIYAPDSGTVHILDEDIRTRPSSIGFCPQQNILYDELTVYEHLKLIACIKGFPLTRLLKREISRVAQLTGLHAPHDLHKQARFLSGGMKRRLCMGMALIGDAKILILDEPTSGLDPFNRRSLWEIIRALKHGRTILLTTHYMEEADALSDRIALMHHGRVRCCGSPLFLKDKFGSGYRLTLSKEAAVFDAEAFKRVWREAIEDEEENNNETSSSSSIVIESEVAREICLRIPATVSKSKMATLLAALETHKHDIGILNYGISSSTVEEVFLRVGSPIDAVTTTTESNSFESNHYHSGGGMQNFNGN